MTALLVIGGIAGWLLVGYLTARFIILMDKRDGYEPIGIGYAYLFTFFGPIGTILVGVILFLMLCVKITNMIHGHFKKITA